MIDTGRYKGHTEGPWEQYSAAAYHAVVLPGDIELIPPKLADAQLIADAPLLLAEVKRLRVYEVAWKMLYHNAIEEGRETRTRTWKEIMELVRSDVKEMVDTEDAVFDEWAKQIIGGFE